MTDLSLLNPQNLTHFSADLELTSNGDGAKTAKVSVVARSGDPVDIPGFGLLVHDFSGMTSKSRIPLDKDHDQSDSIGYLNNFDISTGDLVCSGVVVLTSPDDPEDETTDLVTKILGGVPYEASIQADDDMTLQFVPEGTTVEVNGREIDGPVTVVTQWQLRAVAICKFGADQNTSTDMMMSKEKKEDKGFFIRFSKQNKVTPNRNINMSESNKVSAVEAKVEETKPVSVETKVEAPVTIAPKVEETQPVSVEAKSEDKPVETVVAVPTELSKVASDVKSDREVFKQFVTCFGAAQAAEYFADGLSYSDALTKFSLAVKKENEDLKTRLAAVDRGGNMPVRFSKVDSETVKGDRKVATKMGNGLASVVTLPGKK